MKKAIFIPDRWVKFIYKEKVCVGITSYFDHTKNEKFIYFISENKVTSIIKFDENLEIRYLEFVKKPQTPKSLNLSTESEIELLISPVLSKETIKELAKKQLNSISNN